jgi:hypothetical protein
MQILTLNSFKSTLSKRVVMKQALILSWQGVLLSRCLTISMIIKKPSLYLVRQQIKIICFIQDSQEKSLY